MRISEEIAEQLRDDIISGVYKPRERLTEIELSKKYNVSRTPIREAIKHLEAGGLIKVEPYHGAVIAELDVEEIKDIYEVRGILEGAAAQLAVSHIDESTLQNLEDSIEKMERYAREKQNVLYAQENETFHRLIYNCCNNKVLIGVIDELMERTALFRRLSFRSASNIKRAIAEHKSLVKALRSGDAAKVQKLSNEHVHLFLSREIMD